MVENTAHDTNYIISRDGRTLLNRKWAGDERALTAYIGHTQPTHSGHYLDLAGSLNQLGWNVNAGDLRGHGGSVGSNQNLSHLDLDNGWEALIDDMELLTNHAFEGVPFDDRILIVQNISGLLTLELLKRNPEVAKHIVISLPAKQRATAFLARAFVKARLKFNAPDVPDDQTVHHLYRFHSARLKNCKRPADVMSANSAMVDKILADPKGFPTPTLGYWSSIFKGNDVAWDWPQKRTNKS